MKPLKVRIPQDVQRQILEQVFYIAKDSVDNATGMGRSSARGNQGHWELARLFN